MSIDYKKVQALSKKILHWENIVSDLEAREEEIQQELAKCNLALSKAKREFYNTLEVTESYSEANQPRAITRPEGEETDGRYGI